jgi:hypothetical protein
MLKGVILICLAVAALCASAVAQDGNGMNASLGMFFISNGDASDIMGTGTAITLEKHVASRGRVDLFGSIGYVTFSNTWSGISCDEKLIPIMLTAKSRQTGTQKAYFGLGVGLIIMDLSIGSLSDSRTDLGLQLLGGLSFGKSMFGELKLLGGSRNGNTGYSLNLGARF